MLVLHGLWSRTGRLALWAEHPAAPGTGDPAAGGVATVPVHPRAAPAGHLRAVLPPGTGRARAGWLNLRLPTAGDLPVPSPGAAGGHPAGEVRLAPWRVPALRLDPAAAWVLLAPRAPGPPPGVLSGASLGHLREVAGLAGDLVRRGRVLPAVRYRRGRARVLWRPVLAGTDARRLRDLAVAQPPAARAEGGAGTAGGVLVAALESLCDAAARAALAGAPVGGSPVGGSPVGGSPVGGSVGGAGAGDVLVAALRGPQAGLADGCARVLAAGLRHWQRDLAGEPVQAGFRLHPPDAGTAGGWRVEFGLHPADRPDRWISAAEVWAGEPGRPAGGDPPGEPGRPAGGDPAEALLAGWGRACRVWPDLAAGLAGPHPTGLDLDPAAAARFVEAAAPALRAAGFGVAVPPGCDEPVLEIAAVLVLGESTAGPDRVPAAGPHVAGTGVVPEPGGPHVAGTGPCLAGAEVVPQPGGLGRPVGYRWEVRLDGRAVEPRELDRLATAPVLLPWRGRWRRSEPGRLATARDLAARRASGTLGDLLRAGLGGGAGPGGLPVAGLRAEGMLADLLTGGAGRSADPPARFRGTLRPYQRRGLAWLDHLQRLGLGALLADDMGLGKTVQVLALLAGDPPGSGATLLVCPLSLLDNWRTEADRFVPDLRVRVHHGAARARGPALAALAAGADLLLTTYPVVARDADDLAGVGWYRVVCDEAQAVRNPATRQAAAVRALPARHRIAMTGTPVENRLADLWSIMDFANPGLLGDLATFRRRYADPVERHGDPHAAARLRRLTGPFLLRRRKDDPAVAPDLPARIDTPVACALTGEQADLYRAVLAEAMTRIDGADGMRRRGLVLATLTRLKQVCDHPELLVRGGGPLGGRSGKVTRIEEIVEQVRAAGEKVLLFTQYARFATLLRDHLVAVTGREVLLLHGRTPRAARDAAVRRFQAAAPGGPAVFVVSLRAGGTGLNLTAAAHVVHVDRWWNPAVEDQASDRAHRIGQTRAVRVHTLACAGTVEERVAEVVRAKRYLSAAAVASGERWLADLSTPQLRELFALDARAVIG